MRRCAPNSGSISQLLLEGLGVDAYRLRVGVDRGGDLAEAVDRHNVGDLPDNIARIVDGLVELRNDHRALAVLAPEHPVPVLVIRKASTWSISSLFGSAEGC